MDKLGKSFYLNDTLTVAKNLLGKYIIRKSGKEHIACRIEETEAYIGSIDKACHAYGGKITNRTKIMYEEGGHAYIYFIYGMYYCLNIVTAEKGNAEAVLIRGGSIVKGKTIACMHRYKKSYTELNNTQIKNLSNGPGKLCIAMNIDKSLNAYDFSGDELFLTTHVPGIANESFDISISKRIGIDYAQEACDFPWRFFLA